MSRTSYNVTAFSCSAADIRDEVVRAFPSAAITYKIDAKRQGIVDSWPADVDDSAARADWGFSPDHDFDRAFREMVADHVPGQKGHYRGRPRRIGGLEQRRHIGVDRNLDAFRTFGAVRQATDGRSLAGADQAVGASNADQTQSLTVHGGHGEHVRADRREIDDERFDRADRAGCHVVAAGRGGQCERPTAHGAVAHRGARCLVDLLMSSPLGR